MENNIKSGIIESKIKCGKNMENNIKNGIMVAFGELFLKSKGVRELFCKKLERNISFFLKKEKIKFKIYSFRERIFIKTLEPGKTARIIGRVFGVAWLSQSLFFENGKLEEISGFVSKNYQNWIKKNESFAIRLKKGSGIKQSGRKIIEEIAKNIKRKVDLEKPKKEIFIEAREQGWFLYFKKKKGSGGLPLGASGKVLTLISGGIDSPVAAYLAAKRGAENIWLHFHSFPLASNKSIEKTKELANIFIDFQPGLKIYFFPFSEIQAEVKTKIIPKYRILLYRRVMLKIAQNIAKKENCSALITGESLGQVSSQTLANIQITNASVSMPVLRPLIAMDKEEIIKKAKKIKTFETSVKPQEDCCTLFTPKHATAQADLKEIEKMEGQLNLKKLIEEGIKKAEFAQY